MKFQPTPEKNSVTVRFSEGSLNKFVEKNDKNELHIGYGNQKPLTRRKYVLLMRKVIATAKQNKITSIAVDFKDLKSFAPNDFSDNEIGKTVATAFVMAEYEHTAYKTKKEDLSIKIAAIINTPESAKRGGFWIGEQIGAEVNACRTLANTPGGDMTPKKLGLAAKNAVKGTGVTVKALGKAEMQKLGMGAVLGMGQGSAEESQFIILEYKGGPAKQKPVVLIGKGVTFDSGGLNIKTGDYMYEMHMDMSGGAAVIHAIALAAKLKIKTNVIGLIPAVENMSSANAVRPGDVLKSLSGRTIEVLNTDAEGRVILADAVTYAKRYDPAVVIENSTLTGAVLTALGQQASGIMTKDAQLQERLIALGEESGDYLWPFPQWEEYEDMVKGNFADVANIPANGNSRYAGVIGGGMFLQEFAKDLKCPFAHLDIASRMTSAPAEFLAKGAAGAPVRLFLKIIESYAK